MDDDLDSKKVEEAAMAGVANEGEDRWMSCPVIRDAERLLELGQSFGRAMRRLRQSQKRCRKCPSQGQCPAMISLNGQIQAAIAEITEEWELG